MIWWSHLSALGGFDITAPVALTIAAWLASARCWRLALTWCALFCVAMTLAAGSQMAFIGWGLGIESLAFTGFSGHATRAAAVYPVALFLLLEKRERRWRRVAVLAGVILAVGVAAARVKIGAHAISEATAGCLLGLCAAAMFITSTRTTGSDAPRPVVLGLLAIVLLLPRGDALNTHQWVTAAALKLSGHDRIFMAHNWQRAQTPYSPPCARERVRFSYLCT